MGGWNDKELGRQYEKASADHAQEMAKRIAAELRIAQLEAELAWYGEQVRLCRLIHSEGDAGRHALAADGGKRARAALTKSET